MNDRDPRHGEHADPHEQNNPVPKVVLGLTLGLVVWAIGYIFWQEPDGAAALGDRRQPAALAGPAAGTQTIADGATIFANACQACHQSTGKGLPGVFPPLAGSEWVLAPPDRIAQILLHGVTGPMKVLGTTYSGAMPAFGTQLSDGEIAAVASFVRTQWGNNAEKLTPAEVARSRQASAGRDEPWKGEAELATFLDAAPPAASQAK